MAVPRDGADHGLLRYCYCLGLGWVGRWIRICESSDGSFVSPPACHSDTVHAHLYTLAPPSAIPVVVLRCCAASSGSTTRCRGCTCWRRAARRSAPASTPTRALRKRSPPRYCRELQSWVARRLRLCSGVTPAPLSLSLCWLTCLAYHLLLSRRVFQDCQRDRPAVCDGPQQV